MEKGFSLFNNVEYECEEEYRAKKQEYKDAINVYKENINVLTQAIKVCKYRENEFKKLTKNGIINRRASVPRQLKFIHTKGAESDKKIIKKYCKTSYIKELTDLEMEYTRLRNNYLELKNEYNKAFESVKEAENAYNTNKQKEESSSTNFNSFNKPSSFNKNTNQNFSNYF